MRAATDAPEPLELPPLPAEAQAAIRALVPFAGPRNPVDSTAQIANDRTLLGRMLRIMLDAGRFERLLPYAVALDVEDAWTEKFTLAVGSAAAAAATAAITWYHGATPGNMGQLASAVGGALSSKIASSATPPGSSYSGGGGGFSGGGGGGSQGKGDNKRRRRWWWL